MIDIPVLDVNDSLTEIELSGATYFLRMSWNSEGGFWVLGVEDYAHTLILAGVRVVANSPLLEMWHNLAVPAGELYAVLMDDTREEVLRTDFADGTCSLIYVEPGEIVTV